MDEGSRISSSPAETMAGVSWASNETVAGGISELCLEADFQHSLLPVAYGVAFVLGLAGNALALHLLSRRARPASHSHIYLINLALADTLLVWVLPLQIHSHLRGGDWTFGAAACRLAGTLLRADVHLGVGLLACVCLDLCVAALRPFAHLRIGAGRRLLLAAALWALALGAAVPPALAGPLGGNATACFEGFPPAGAAAAVLGAAVPCALVLGGWPLAAGRVCRSGRGVRRRKALSTLGLVLAVWALCFLPYHLSLLPRFPAGGRLVSALSCGVRRVAPALVSLGCCKTPLLYYCGSPGKRWRCSFRLRFRSKKVFTICDRSFGQPSCGYKLQQRPGSRKPGDGVNWSALSPRGF